MVRTFHLKKASVKTFVYTYILTSVSLKSEQPQHIPKGKVPKTTIQIVFGGQTIYHNSKENRSAGQRGIFWGVKKSKPALLKPVATAFFTKP